MLSVIVTSSVITFADAQSEKLVILKTNLGDITIELFPDDAPNHAANFIELAESGFYDETLFHRIIKGFMIQGGDPNTISGDPATWGQGGPSTSLVAEFNDIKHNRGIVSMARAQDPNSAGSQFFIVHQDSNFLDGQYTVFGRIVTQESFDTLDAIAEVDTGTQDRPIEPESVRIISAETTSRAEISDLLDLDDPKRVESPVMSSIENQRYDSEELNVSLLMPAGWLVQSNNKTDPREPDIIAIGAQSGAIPPLISLTVSSTNQRTLDDIINEKNNELQEVIDSGILEIISRERTTINGYAAHEIIAQGSSSINNQNIDIKFRETTIHTTEKIYTISYANVVDNYDFSEPRFIETVESFALLNDNSDDNNDDNSDNNDGDTISEKSDTTPADGGGCLVATAAFGSEIAPQVQRLREIRDSTLLTTNYGTAFMTGFNQIYYLFSPTIADLEREIPIFRELTRAYITPLLSSLSIMEHADSESKVLGYGIGVILLNIGMYVGLPASIIYKICNITKHRRLHQEPCTLSPDRALLS